MNTRERRNKFGEHATMLEGARCSRMNTGKTNCMPRQQLADYDLPPMPALEQVSTMLLSSNRALPFPMRLKTERRGTGDDIRIGALRRTDSAIMLVTVIG